MRFGSLISLALFTGVVLAVEQQCASNQECQDQLGDPDACCMYSEAKDGWKGFSCRSHDAWSKLIKTDVNGIGLRIWGNPNNQGERYMAYCKSDENAYPYEQHYANPYELLPRADPNNDVVYSDVFYKPKQI